ncbi:unnamed protein product [Moneuplotes crassus]|uniref:Uncharacterized protein n=1 Tax=Euplotes crassus TaxID=5936 RepID=A0AAD1U361_EUPCR|nr:unnamed protein product [Moneuplotes crassus]
MFKDIFNPNPDFPDEVHGNFCESELQSLIRLESSVTLCNNDFEFRNSVNQSCDTFLKKSSILQNDTKLADQGLSNLEFTKPNSQFLLNEGLIAEEAQCEESYFTIPRSNLFKEYFDGLRSEEHDRDNSKENHMHVDLDSKVRAESSDFEQMLYEEDSNIPEKKEFSQTYVDFLDKPEPKPDLWAPTKGMRWSKQDDIELFRLFRMCEDQGLLTLNEIKHFDSSTKVSKVPAMQMIKETLGCRQSCRFLANRIKIKMKDSFSIRETRLLKRLIKKYNYDDIPHLELLEHFAGKTLEGMQNACANLCTNKKQKRLRKVKQA